MLVAHDVSGPVDYLAMLRGLDRAEFPELREIVLVAEGRARRKASRTGAGRWRAGRSPCRRRTFARRAGLEGRSRCGGVHHVHLRHHRLPQGGRCTPTKLIRNNEERGFKMGLDGPGHHPETTCRCSTPSAIPRARVMSPLFGTGQILTATFDPDECLDLVEGRGRDRDARLRGPYAGGFARRRRPARADLSSLRTGLFAAGMKKRHPRRPARRGAEVLKPMRAVSGFGMTEVWLGVSVCSVDGRPRAPHRDLRLSRARLRDAHPSIRDTGAPCPARRRGRAAGARLQPDAGLLQEARRDRRELRGGRLVPHRRHGRLARGRLHALPRALQGHAQGRRRECRSDGRSRGCCSTTPEIRQTAVVGAPGRAGWRKLQPPMWKREPGQPARTPRP